MNDSYPPLLRGAGGLLVLLAAIVAANINDKASQETAHLAYGISRFDVSKPYASLTEDEKKERVYRVAFNLASDRLAHLDYDLEKRTLITEMTQNPALKWETFLGTGLLVGSYFFEWWQKRQKALVAAGKS